jgi:hypothetical protein
MNNQCVPKFGGDGINKYMPQCTNGRFRDGTYSHIRGDGSDLQPYSKVFPGTAPLGNESGANGPIYVYNGDGGPVIIIRRRYIGPHEQHKIHWRSEGPTLPAPSGSF